jgi:hypothetical protein
MIPIDFGISIWILVHSSDRWTFEGLMALNAGSLSLQ